MRLPTDPNRLAQRRESARNNDELAMREPSSFVHAYPICDMLMCLHV